MLTTERSTAALCGDTGLPHKTINLLQCRQPPDRVERRKTILPRRRAGFSHERHARSSPRRRSTKVYAE